MTQNKARQTVSLIASQIEAASTLLKFAADDLADLLASERTIFADELRAVVINLHSQTATLDGNAAFLSRLDLLGADEQEDEDQAWSAA